MRRIILFPLLFLLVKGCVRIPKSEIESRLSPPPSLNQITEEALATSSFETGEFPSENWWEMFQDPYLCEWIQRALASNPSLKKVAARVEMAKQEAKIKKSSLFPTLGLRAEVDWQYLSKNDFERAFTPVVPGNITEYFLDLDFSYEFDFWQKHNNRFRSALGIAKAKQAEYAQAKLSLSIAVALSYFKLQSLFAKLNILKHKQEVFAQLFQLVKLREVHALDTLFQQLDIQESLFEVEQNIIFTEKQIVLEKHLFRFLLGEGPEEGCKIEEAELRYTDSFPLPKHISCDLLARRPDLMAQIWRVESAAHLVGAAKADFYPNVDLTALAGLDSVFFRKFFRWESRTGFLKPALHLPIFTAGRLRAQLREKEAELEESIEMYQELVLQAVQEVADAIVELRASDEQLATQLRMVRNKEENRDLSSLSYENALRNRLEVLVTEQQVLTQKFALIKMQYHRYVASLKLIKSLGGGYLTRKTIFSDGKSK